MPGKFRLKKVGNNVLMDEGIHDWLTTPEERQRPVDPAQLSQMIDRADRIIVSQGPWRDAEMLFASSDRTDLDDLKGAIKVAPPPEGFHCMCCGEPCIHLYQGDERIAELTNHHGRSIRFSEWHSDALLLDIEPWIAWFDQRGIDGPRREIEQSERERVRSDEQLRRWMDTMPLCLVPIWKESLDQWGMPDVPLLSRTLRRSMSARDERIRALLYWFGSGAGSWSGFPTYESATEKLLLAERHDALVEVCQSPDLSPAQLEGAARLFGGWDYSKRYPDGTDRLPVTLKQRLWDGVKGTEDQDKLRRATRAFRQADSSPP